MGHQRRDGEMHAFGEMRDGRRLRCRDLHVCPTDDYVEGCVQFAGIFLHCAISGAEPLNINRNPLIEARAFPHLSSDATSAVRVVGALLWGVIAYVAGVPGRVARWRPPLTGDCRTRLSATDRRARPPRRVPIMLSDPRTDFDLSRTNAVQTPPYST
jgi:hypothetical protein